MSVFLQPIYTQTVGSGGVSSVTFNNIPQTFTDLKIVFSGRTSDTGNDRAVPFVWVNGTGDNSTNTRLYAIPNVANGSDRSSGGFIGYASTATNTANTFGSQEIYIPNYTSANFKQMIVDGVSESNSTTQTGLTLVATMFRTTSAVTSFSIISSAGNWVQYSTFTLYGITRG
jgi:hypothetical protein